MGICVTKLTSMPEKSSLSTCHFYANEQLRLMKAFGLNGLCMGIVDLYGPKIEKIFNSMKIFLIAALECFVTLKKVNIIYRTLSRHSYSFKDMILVILYPLFFIVQKNNIFTSSHFQK